MAHEDLDVPEAVRFVDEFIQILNLGLELDDVAMRNQGRHGAPRSSPSRVAERIFTS